MQKPTTQWHPRTILH